MQMFCCLTPNADKRKSHDNSTVNNEPDEPQDVDIVPEKVKDVDNGAVKSKAAVDSHSIKERYERSIALTLFCEDVLIKHCMMILLGYDKGFFVYLCITLLADLVVSLTTCHTLHTMHTFELFKDLDGDQQISMITHF